MGAARLLVDEEDATVDGAVCGTHALLARSAGRADGAGRAGVAVLARSACGCEGHG